MRGGQIGRIAVGADADAGKSDALQPGLGGEFQRMAVAGGEQRRFAVLSVAPDGADGVDDVPGRETEAGGDFGLPCGAAVQGTTVGQQLRPGGAVNGSVDSAAAQEGIVGGVDDGVDGQCRNIGTDDTQGGGHDEIGIGGAKYTLSRACRKEGTVKTMGGSMMRRVLAMGMLLAAAGATNAQTQRASLEVGRHRIEVEVAADEQTRKLGLMYRSRLPSGQGMLFVYPFSIRLCMWMKNTLIPLSVAFLDEEGRILNIEDMAPLSEESHCSVGSARHALEMNQGWFAEHGVKAGDRVGGVKSLSAN